MDLRLFHHKDRPNADYETMDRKNSRTGSFHVDYLEWTGWYDTSVHMRLLGHYRLFQQYKKSGPIFAEKYLSMLKCGGSLTPQELMAQVDVDLEDPAFWQGGFDALEVLVSRFEELWAEYKFA